MPGGGCFLERMKKMAKLWGGRFDGKNEAWIDALGRRFLLTKN